MLEKQKKESGGGGKIAISFLFQAFQKWTDTEMVAGILNRAELSPIDGSN